MEDGLKEVDFLLNYASKSEELADFEEALLAHKECVNVSKTIINQQGHSDALKKELMQFTMECIKRGAAVKNVCYTKNLKKAASKTQKRKDQEKEESKKNEIEERLDKYFESEKAQDWSPNQKKKIVEMSRLIWISKSDVSFEDVVGLEEAKDCVETIIIDRIRYPEISKMFKGKSKGILFYGKPFGKILIAFMLTL